MKFTKKEIELYDKLCIGNDKCNDIIVSFDEASNMTYDDALKIIREKTKQDNKKEFGFLYDLEDKKLISPIFNGYKRTVKPFSYLDVVYHMGNDIYILEKNEHIANKLQTGLFHTHPYDEGLEVDNCFFSDNDLMNFTEYEVILNKKKTRKLMYESSLGCLDKNSDITVKKIKMKNENDVLSLEKAMNINPNTDLEEYKKLWYNMIRIFNNKKYIDLGDKSIVDVQDEIVDKITVIETKIDNGMQLDIIEKNMFNDFWKMTKIYTTKKLNDIGIDIIIEK